MQSERYLFVVQTYIELNPVRAGMVRHPAAYPWSSYLSNASGSPSGVITPHERYLAISRDPLERGSAYQRLFGIPPTHRELALIREAIAAGYALGDQAFTQELEEMKGISVTPRKPGPKRTASELGVCPLFK